MKAGELIKILENLNPETPIMMCHYRTLWDCGIEETYHFEAESVKVYEDGAYLQLPSDYESKMLEMEEREYQDFY